MFAPSQLNELTDGFEASLADDLDQYPLSPTPVELAVEDLLPRAEVELAARDRHHHLPPHHLALQVRVSVVLSRPVVEILRYRLVGCEPLQPTFIILVEAALVVVDEDGCSNMHRVAKQESFFDSAFPQTCFDLRRDVDECPSCRNVEPKFLPVAFQFQPPPG